MIDEDEEREESCARKKRYSSAEFAGNAAATLRKFKRPGADRLRVYPCRFCLGYHLTKAPLEKIAEWKAGERT